MELAEAEKILARLYADVRPYEVSHESRKRLSTQDESFRYGEVVPAALDRLLNRTPCKANGIFYDLGSGTGKAVFQAALTADFSKLVGVELIDGLSRVAEHVLSRYDVEVRPRLPVEKRLQVIEFRRADIRLAEIAEADLVYVHATCFQPELMKGLTARLDTLKPGARAVLTTKCISSPRFSIEAVDVYDMDWGSTPVFCLVKRS